MMEGMDQQGKCSYDHQVNSTTSVLSDGGPQNLMHGISQESPKEIQFFEIAPPANELVDLNLRLSLGGLYKEITESPSPNPNPLLLTATRATAVNNVNPPITSAQNNNGILPPLPQPRPPLPPYYTTDNNNMDHITLNEIATYQEAQKKRQVEAYRRYIVRRRAHERTEAKKAAAVAAFPPAPPLTAAAAAATAAAQPPQAPLPKPIALPGAVASDTENHELSRAVEKMNALGESSGKKILEGASALATGIGSLSSQQSWTSHQPNSYAKACAAKVIYGKSAIVIENISHDEQPKRPRLFNVVQNNNAHQKNRISNEGSGMKQLMTVTTTGDGPKGKKVDGFLYKCGKGDHIFIVCFCHGVFLSPIDFVKHANHTDWSNPMKHIAVTSPPSP